MRLPSSVKKKKDNNISWLENKDFLLDNEEIQSLRLSLTFIAHLLGIITLKNILWHHPTKITLEKPQDSHKTNTSLQQKGGENCSGCIKSRH